MTINEMQRCLAIVAHVAQSSGLGHAHRQILKHVPPAPPTPPKVAQVAQVAQCLERLVCAHMGSY